LGKYFVNSPDTLGEVLEDDVNAGDGQLHLFEFVGKEHPWKLCRRGIARGKTPNGMRLTPSVAVVLPADTSQLTIGF
jgi:hypothetical protein